MIYIDKYGNKLQLTVDEYVELCVKSNESIPKILGETEKERVEKWNKLRDEGITLTDTTVYPTPFYHFNTSSVTPL